MGLILSINIKLRKIALKLYDIIAPRIIRTRITKVRIRGKTLGAGLFTLFNRFLYCRLPDPISLCDIIIYHGLSDGRKWLGWPYAFDCERDARLLFEKIVKQGMAVVDIGANIGYYTLLSAKLVGVQGKVYAFEPDPGFYALLEKNIRVNRFDQTVESFRIAIGNRKDNVALFLGKATGTSLFKVPDLNGESLEVEMLSLDIFFAQRNWPPVDLVKIDAEGADKIALEGMRELVKKNRELKLIVELHPYLLKMAGTSAEELLLLLNDVGFKYAKIISKKGRLYKIHPDIQNLVELAEKKSFINLFCY